MRTSCTAIISISQHKAPGALTNMTAVATNLECSKAQGCLVIPCYNEEAIIQRSVREILIHTRNSCELLDIVFVDDGSIDNTWEIIRRLASQEPEVKAILLDKNSGHQAALLAGIAFANQSGYGYCITLDCDLQDDLTAIPEMISAHYKGFHLVLAAHTSRRSDGRLKRLTASLYYFIMQLVGMPLVPHHAEFRLLSDRAMRALINLKAERLYLRSQVLELGFRHQVIIYERKQGLSRLRKSRYTLKHMIALALDGAVTSSVLPLRLLFILGILFGIICFMLLTLITYLAASGKAVAVPGWSSTMIVSLLNASVTLLGMGVLGEYLTRIYRGQRRAPFYQIVSIKNDSAKSNIDSTQKCN